MEKLINQIAKEMLAEPEEIFNIKIDNGMVDFYYLEKWFWAKVTKTNKLKKNSIRRSI